MVSRRVSLLVLPLTLIACMYGEPEIRSFQTPSVDGRIPTGIVLHPLLSSQVEGSWGRTYPMFNQSREHIYIRPPAKTTLQVTGTSERLTGMLTMELLQRGFKLHELPVEAPVEGENAFAVSLALLDELREKSGVHAILIGNAFFAHPGRYDDVHVTDLYLKVVDVETLEVLGQVALTHDSDGWPMDRIASEVADQLAAGAGLIAQVNEE